MQESPFSLFLFQKEKKREIVLQYQGKRVTLFVKMTTQQTTKKKKWKRHGLKAVQKNE